MKAKIVKAEVFSDLHFRAYSCGPKEVLLGSPGHIVVCPHNWTITARPPRPKASKKKGGKK